MSTFKDFKCKIFDAHNQKKPFFSLRQSHLTYLLPYKQIRPVIVKQ
jgi:hypothetical protein